MPAKAEEAANEAAPAVPRKARTVLKRADPPPASAPTSGKDDGNGKETATVKAVKAAKPRTKPGGKVTTETEQDVAEALFDLANLATFMEAEGAEADAAAAAEGAAGAAVKRKRQRSKKDAAADAEDADDMPIVSNAVGGGGTNGNGKESAAGKKG
eukprot:CAMPEP_0197578318 /NCGR_PEP_ID=MMETSP1326-20131121/2585_1 /TAXON_ID=1155430 /ORGANISM="Genus nov. species nov., Strain RCC2288" /LENGTH=155 /DNA_ID=CAMNT_0043141487 /DNA_START=204 /DNA_END=667 /DNA_ORIENTATION=-